MKMIQTLGRNSLRYVSAVGASSLFLWQTLFRAPRFFRSFPLLIQALFSVGVLSLPIILVSGLFIGMVLGLQGYNVLNTFNSTVQLGQLVALSVTRELGPVVTALLFTGRAGSALTAEIALMKTTEQLASMEMLGVDPLWRVIAPRFWAGFYAMPLLSLIFSAVAIWGSYFVGVDWLGVDSGSFWNNMQSSVDFHIDILSGIKKSVVFGFVTTWIAVYQGYAAEPTAEGVGRATTRTVVYGSLAILGLDFVLTTSMLGGW